jgi:hypothetical protein
VCAGDSGRVHHRGQAFAEHRAGQLHSCRGSAGGEPARRCGQLGTGGA